MLFMAAPGVTDTVLGAGFDKYLPLINALALIFIGIYTKVKQEKAVVIASETKATVATTEAKIDVVHTLVNNAASKQQEKVDALEKELRELRGIFDKMTLGGQLPAGVVRPQQEKG